jgi:hypothetical protein
MSGALQLVISTLHNFSPLLFPIIRKPEKSARHFLHEVASATLNNPSRLSTGAATLVRIAELPRQQKGNFDPSLNWVASLV